MGKLIREGNREIKETMEDLLKNIPVRMELDEQIVYSDLESDENAIWSLLLAELRGRYILTSNRESGFGRYDVMLEPLKEEDTAIIIEFKVFRPGKEQTLEDTVRSALAQIEEKQYTAVLEGKGIGPERIRKYGFAFEGKRVLIG